MLFGGGVRPVILLGGGVARVILLGGRVGLVVLCSTRYLLDGAVGRVISQELWCGSRDLVRR